MRFCVVALSLCLLCGCVDSSKKQAEAPIPKAPASTSQGGSLLNARQPGPTDPDAPKEFTELSSGLKYRVLRKTDGPKPQDNDRILANYRGTLDDGTEFDASYNRGESLPVVVKEGPGGVIAGWVEGLKYCPVGGMIELDIPPDLAYADSPPPGIPAGARLHFITEVVEIQ